MRYIQLVKSANKLLEKSIIDAELQLGINFPVSYIKFLTIHNGGTDMSGNRFITDDRASLNPNLPWFYSINKSSNTSVNDDLVQENLYMSDRLPKGLISIGYNGHGHIVIDCNKGEKYHKIYYWNQSFEENVPTYNNVSFVANNFEEFINGLIDSEDLELISEEYEKNDDIRLYKLIQKLGTEGLSTQYAEIDDELKKVIDIISGNEDLDLSELLERVLYSEQKEHLKELISSI